MAYTVLARRYRSTSFDELVGQEAIAATLKAAIAHNRVAHAYLFTGTRGVGKTSTARIFAKALNAVDEKGREDPAVAEAIMKGQDTDVIEIDAASNNSVDQARDLIASSVYRPLRGRKKVYIIDEVHMLTTAAFNALLKTMEEPPEHVVFILCTTETHKVPATIQSRCQRFDFRNIPTAKIVEHLAEVITSEGASAEPELVHQVARLGNGSMRDALSLLDRLMAAGEKKLTVRLLEDLLGLPDRELVAGLIGALAASDPAGALKQADALLKRGVSPEQLLAELADRLRDLMVICACGPETDLVDLGDDSRRRAVEQAARFDAAGLTHLIAICDAVARSAKSVSNPRAILDAAIVRLSLSEKFADATALLSGRVHSPGARAGSGAPPTPALAGAGAKK
jgi:DNA polymerase-3 subunit gamma/tau